MPLSWVSGAPQAYRPVGPSMSDRAQPFFGHLLVL